MVVEVDKTYFGKRKYNRGRFALWEKWGFERDSGRRFDQGIADKATLTLQMKNIFYQELIISGGWTSYSTIFQILGKKEIFCNYT